MTKGNSTYSIFSIPVPRGRRMRWVAFTTLLASVVAAAALWMMPDIYECEVVLSTEQESGAKTTGSSTSATGAEATNTEASAAAENIFRQELAARLSAPVTFPDIVGSTDFQRNLFDARVRPTQKSRTITYYEHLAGKPLPHSFRNPTFSEGKEPKVMGKVEYETLQKIRMNVRSSHDTEENIISIWVRDTDPVVAATIADTVKNRLVVQISRYRTNKARHDLAFYIKREQDAKAVYDSVCKAYSDSIRGRIDRFEKKYRSEDAQVGSAQTDEFSFPEEVASANAEAEKAQLEQQRSEQDLRIDSIRSSLDARENGLQMHYETYKRAAAELEEARARIQHRTPVFTLIQGAEVPMEPCSPHRRLWLGIVFAISLILSWTVAVKWSSNTKNITQQ